MQATVSAQLNITLNITLPMIFQFSIFSSYFAISVSIAVNSVNTGLQLLWAADTARLGLLFQFLRRWINTPAEVPRLNSAKLCGLLAFMQNYVILVIICENYTIRPKTA